MYMVSQSKVKRSEKTKLNYDSFLQSIKNITKTAFMKAEDYQNKMLEEGEEKKSIYILVSSDTGLAGGYNNQIFRYFSDYIKTIDHEFYVGTIGRKAYSYAQSREYNLINDKAILIRDDVMFIDIQPIVDLFIKYYFNHNVDHVYVIYNHFVNSMVCDVKMVQLLPLTKVEGEVYDGQYIFENGAESCLNDLIPMYIASVLYGYILDAKTAEHSSRMNAMKNASDNVDEIIEKFELIYNRARQQAITTELTDIIAGSNAVKDDKEEKTIEGINQNLYDTYKENAQIQFITIYSAHELLIEEEKQIKDILANYYHNHIHLIKKIDLDIKAGYYLFVNNKRVDFNLNNMVKQLKTNI